MGHWRRRWTSKADQIEEDACMTPCEQDVDKEKPSLGRVVLTPGPKACKGHVAVVGSGFAGLYCADRLVDLGFRVTLFRSRSRLSATQMENEHNTIFTKPGAPFFDYGCQLITAGEPWFRDEMASFEAEGFCYRPEVHVLSAKGGLEKFDSPPGWAGRQGMWAFQEDAVQHVARKKGIEVISTAQARPGTKFPDFPLVVEDYSRSRDGWVLRNKQGKAYGPFDKFCGAFNSHKMVSLQLNSKDTAQIGDYLKKCRFATPVVAMVAFDRSLDLDFSAAFVAEDKCLAWVCNNNKKVAPGQSVRGDRELWTFIGKADYSFHTFYDLGNRYKQRAFEDFLSSFSKLVGKNVKAYGPKVVRIMQWECGIEAFTIPSDAGCVWDEDNQLGWCGPWATYASVEGAAESGRRLAEVIAGGSIPKEKLCYPEGDWLEAECRLKPGYLRLDHGFFHLDHPRLKSIKPPPCSDVKNFEKFWDQFGGYDNPSTGHNSGYSKGKGKGKGGTKRARNYH